MSWQGSMSVTTAVGSGVPLASSDAGADDGPGDALGAGAWIGGGLALTMAAAIWDGVVVPVLEQPATASAAMRAKAPAWRPRTI
jgi:hypothetical protein